MPVSHLILRINRMGERIDRGAVLPIHSVEVNNAIVHPPDPCSQVVYRTNGIGASRRKAVRFNPGANNANSSAV